MEKEEINEEIKKEQSQQKITTPMAIILAGVLIMVGILLTNGGGKVTKEKTLSEQVGVSKEKLMACVEKTDNEALGTKIETSVTSAMKALPNDQRGTPYSVVIGSNGVKAEIRGADSEENVKKLIADVIAGTVTEKYEGEIVVSEEGDHLMGNPDAQVKIIEYSDFECPYCKIFHATLKKIVSESNGSVSWVYRHWPLHQNSFEKVVAAECVAQLKGNEAYWEYSDLLFGLLKTAADPVTEQL
jgi:hypothetical protein